MHKLDAVVVGAGLAGLRAAVRLAEAGLEVVVVEANDVVGGRERSDEVDGFVLDLGFHVFNPVYPAVRRWIDVEALGLRRFPAGVRVRRENALVELAHPLRHPTRLSVTLASGLLDPRDAVALARWAMPALVSPRSVIDGADTSLRESWDSVGFTGRLRREVLEPFLAGVIADDAGRGGGDTSAAFVRLLVRTFALGRPGVPERGIGAVPAQLATTARAAGARILLGRRVSAVSATAGGVEIAVDDAETLRARAAVVAVPAEAARGLVGIATPQTKGLQTWWFEAPESPSASGMLRVDGRRRGPVVNTAVMSRTAPSYAPPGRHLVQATCLLPRTGAADEADVRAQLREVWGRQTAEWRLLRRDDLPHALPSQPAPLRTRSIARVSDGVYVAGDHRDTASIQGALVSGDRAARAMLADLTGGR